jgi:uncharacterized membrane protein YgdD (TMEM256/DUF423 family)
MQPRTCIAVGALWAALGVILGAFGAHALEARLEGAGQVASWQTAVRYQMWHALALLLVGALGARWGRLGFAPWGFLVGSVLFSGSIYCLALDVARPVMGPITPLGGLLMIAGWVALAWKAWRAPGAGD